MNLAFEGTVAPNTTVVALDCEVSEGEMWRLSLLTVQHHPQHVAQHEQLASPPGTLTASLYIATLNGTEDRLVYTFSGDQPFLRQPLFSVLEAGDRLRITIASRHHEHPVLFEGFVSLERRSMTVNGALRVAETTGLVPTEYDEISLTYAGDDLTGVEYRQAGVVVATLALTYSGGRLAGVVRT